MISFLKRFSTDASGAVTVDWVVLTAATVGIGFLVLMSVSASVQTKTEIITAAIIE